MLFFLPSCLSAEAIQQVLKNQKFSDLTVNFFGEHVEKRCKPHPFLVCLCERPGPCAVCIAVSSSTGKNEPACSTLLSLSCFFFPPCLDPFSSSCSLCSRACGEQPPGPLCRRCQRLWPAHGSNTRRGRSNRHSSTGWHTLGVCSLFFWGGGGGEEERRVLCGWVGGWVLFSLFRRLFCFQPSVLNLATANECALFVAGPVFQAQEVD